MKNAKTKNSGLRRLFFVDAIFTYLRQFFFFYNILHFIDLRYRCGQSFTNIWMFCIQLNKRGSTIWFSSPNCFSSRCRCQWIHSKDCSIKLSSLLTGWLTECDGIEEAFWFYLRVYISFSSLLNKVLSERGILWMLLKYIVQNW